MNRLLFLSVSLIFSLAVALKFAPAAKAEFSLNFGATPMSQIHGGSTMSGQTSFYVNFHVYANDYVFDPSTGQYYYHMQVGDPASGFIQESYVQVGTIGTDVEKSCVGNICSTSLNNNDPLGGTGSYNTGNGATNPRGVIIRQILSDGEIVSEFLKDQYLRKPLITQMISSNDMTALFQFDMRNSTYDDMNTPGVIQNYIWYPNPDIKTFDMSLDVQNSYVTGGRYTYTNGTGSGGSQGTYNYLDGGMSLPTDWTPYMDKLDTHNVWSYPTYKPQ